MSQVIQIYLCDLVHNYLGAGTYMFPLNIGYLAAYCKKYLDKKVNIKLFKYPDSLLTEIQRNPPHVIGFTNYTWNAHINKKFADYVKNISQNIMVVFGGPNINYSESGVKKFFGYCRSVDFYVPYQGETPFKNLIAELIENNLNANKLKEKELDGVYYYHQKRDKIIMGKKISRIKKPDDIPSPYLTGILDDFFSTTLIPIVETNRGCPYQCTFCCQGLSSHRQIDYFSLDRVKQELEYIALKVKNTNLLNLADSNFGIAKRDFEIAEFINQLEKRTGYPHKVSTNWAKNQDKIFEIAKTLNNIILVVSLQSLEEDVLKTIKRKNINIEVFNKIVKKINHAGGISGTEIILGLPKETKQSHINTIKSLFEWDASYIICYNCLILEGSELSLQREQGDFQCKTKYRLIDSAFGKYGEIEAFEHEEGILETDSMLQKDILFFRPVHWLIQFLWNYRFYYGLMKYLQELGVNPFDFIIQLVQNVHNSPQLIEQIFSEFNKEAKEEWFDSIEDLHKHYKKPEIFSRLENGEFGKMNGKYIFKVLAEAKEDFEKYLLDTALCFEKLNNKSTILSDIIKFLSIRIIDFSRNWNEIAQDKVLNLDYDLLAWQKGLYKQFPKKVFEKDKSNLRFYISKEHFESLKKLYNQYKHKELNVTLRKMGEFMPISDFFYQIEYC